MSNFKFAPSNKSYVINFINAAIDLIHESKRIELQSTIFVRREYQIKAVSRVELSKINTTLSELRVNRSRVIKSLTTIQRRLKERDWDSVDALLGDMVNDTEGLMEIVLRLKHAMSY